jgi:hypothetical protein
MKIIPPSKGVQGDVLWRTGTGNPKDTPLRPPEAVKKL